jgi:predicted small metal-binding protein
MGRDMFADKALRCDCGHEVRAYDESDLVEAVRRHAWEAHGISFSTEEALAVLLRIELEEGMPAADPAIVEETTGREESK